MSKKGRYRTPYDRYEVPTYSDWSQPSPSSAKTDQSTISSIPSTSKESLPELSTTNPSQQSSSKSYRFDVAELNKRTSCAFQWIEEDKKQKSLASWTNDNIRIYNSIHRDLEKAKTQSDLTVLENRFAVLLESMTKYNTLRENALALLIQPESRAKGYMAMPDESGVKRSHTPQPGDNIIPHQIELIPKSVVEQTPIFSMVESQSKYGLSPPISSINDSLPKTERISITLPKTWDDPTRENAESLVSHLRYWLKLDKKYLENSRWKELSEQHTALGKGLKESLGKSNSNPNAWFSSAVAIVRDLAKDNQSRMNTVAQYGIPETADRDWASSANEKDGGLGEDWTRTQSSRQADGSKQAVTRMKSSRLDKNSSIDISPDQRRVIYDRTAKALKEYLDEWATDLIGLNKLDKKEWKAKEKEYQPLHESLEDPVYDLQRRLKKMCELADFLNSHATDRRREVQWQELVLPLTQSFNTVLNESRSEGYQEPCTAQTTPTPSEISRMATPSIQASSSAPRHSKKHKSRTIDTASVPQHQSPSSTRSHTQKSDNFHLPKKAERDSFYKLVEDWLDENKKGLEKNKAENWKLLRNDNRHREFEEMVTKAEGLDKSMRKAKESRSSKYPALKDEAKYLWFNLGTWVHQLELGEGETLSQRHAELFMRRANR